MTAEITTADVGANVEMMTVDVGVKETETTTQITMDVTTGQIFVLNPVLSKGLLCSTRIRDAGVRNLRITVAIVKVTEMFVPKKCAGGSPAHFFNIRMTLEA